MINFNISVVIPLLNAEEYLPGLLNKIEEQTLLPKEIIIIDSSTSSRTFDELKKWEDTIPIIYRKLDFAYPGHARNIGAGLARNEWIAFIDVRAIPNHDWLELSASEAAKSGAEFIETMRLTDANTHFKKYFVQRHMAVQEQKACQALLFQLKFLRNLRGLFRIFVREKI